jgi:hypothetical protein
MNNLLQQTAKLESQIQFVTEEYNAYESAFNQFATAKGNIVSRVEELRKMGVNAKKQLSERLLKEE